MKIRIATVVTARCTGDGGVGVGGDVPYPCIKGCWGVAMETSLCFPFLNYLAAGCQLETPDMFLPN